MSVSCNTESDYNIVAGVIWNTSYSIKFQGDISLSDSVLHVMHDVEMSLSPFNSGSVISKVNSNDSVEIDSHIERVFDISSRVNQLSKGAFDPTVSTLVNLWGFGYAGHEAVVPSDSSISVALSSVGIIDCYIDGGRMIKKTPATTFNFSAVTKGYCCDEIARMFKRNGVDDYMVEIGGDLALGGVNNRHVPWRVMVDAPVDSVAGYKRLLTIQLTDCGIATSGNYRNFHDTSAGRVGHTISPVTGRPVFTGMLSATVVAQNCSMADALATACMAMPVDSAMAMIESLPGVESLIVISVGDSMVVNATSGFPL